MDEFLEDVERKEEQINIKNAKEQAMLYLSQNVEDEGQTK